MGTFPSRASLTTESYDLVVFMNGGLGGPFGTVKTFTKCRTEASFSCMKSPSLVKHPRDAELSSMHDADECEVIPS
jgi:hypothetical protein